MTLAFSMDVGWVFAGFAVGILIGLATADLWSPLRREIRTIIADIKKDQA